MMMMMKLSVAPLLLTMMTVLPADGRSPLSSVGSSSSSASDDAIHMMTREGGRGGSGDWISLQEGLEFRAGHAGAAADDAPNHGHLRQLWGSSSGGSNAANHRFNGIFADGSETLYDGYATAWRFLGLYQDCDACVMGDNNNGEVQSAAECIANGIQTSCKRYALWAAVSIRS
jgi:hypothetical protein